jgi:hypothetical protein
MDSHLSAFGILNYWYGTGTGLGVGVRYQKTMVPEGVLKNDKIKDDIGIEGGVDYFHYSFGIFATDWSYNEFAPVVGAVWNFWLTPQLALYPKLDLGYRFGWWSTNSGIGDPGGFGGLFVQGAAGVVYKLEKLTLRAEAGSGMLRAGVGFVF